MSDLLKEALYNYDYWVNIGVPYGYGTQTSWAKHVPDIWNKKISPEMWCIEQIKTITLNQAKEIFPKCFYIAYKNYQKRSSMLETLLENHTIIFNYTLYLSCFRNRKALSYFIEKGYVPTINDLTKSFSEKILGKRLRSSNTPKNILQTYAGMSYNISKEEIHKIIEMDGTILKKTIVGAEFMSNFDLEQRHHQVMYQLFLDELFNEPVKLLTILKLLKRNIPYSCLQCLIRLSNFSDEEKYSIIEYTYVEPFKKGDESVIVNNLDILMKYPNDIPEIIDWLCSGDANIVLNPIKHLRKKVKFEFEQKHLSTACNNPKKNYTLIKYILENSSRDKVIVTRNVFDQILSIGRVPRHVGMVAKYIKLQGDVI